jgi:Do/DeqQ family serine protease
MKKLMNSFLMAALGGAVSLGAYKYLETEDNQIKDTPKDETTQLVNLISSNPENAIDYVTAAEMTVNGVVHVKTEGTIEYTQRAFDPFRHFFYGNGNIEKEYSQPIKGAGSGVIISEDGYMVTNNHVIENADKIKVTLNNKKTYEAALIGTDPATDLAVLKIDEEGLPHLAFGNSDQIHIGEWVLAVGNPFNLTSTVTAGIVSAKGRDINILSNDPYTGLSSIESFIQTDAAVNPGNSGGALVNTKGELIGINAAIKSNTGSFAGYSFAIPSNIARKVVDDIIEYGSVQRAFIGINIRDIDEKLAEEMEISDLNGVYVSGLSPNGSAKEAGIKEGDIVKEVEGFEVRNVNELQAKIGEYRPGDKISVTLYRKGEYVKKQVTLKNLEGNTSIMVEDHIDLLKSLGAKFSNLSKEEKEKLGVDGGVKVAELFPGKLRATGMQEGFVITSIDNQKINDREELLQKLEDKEGGILIQGIYEKGRNVYYGLGMK